MAAAAPIKFTVAERILYPEGKHLAQIVDYAPATGQFGPQIRWKFELVEFEREDGEPAWVSYFTSMAISQKSKLGKLFMACKIPLPVDADEAASIDANSLIGKQIYVQLVHGMGADGQVYSNVAKDGLLPVPKSKAAANELSMPPKSPVRDEPPTTPAVDPLADESLPRMRLRKNWDLLAKKAAVLEVTVGPFPTEKTDKEISDEIAALKRVLAAKEEELEAAEPDIFVNA